MDNGRSDDGRTIDGQTPADSPGLSSASLVVCQSVICQSLVDGPVVSQSDLTAPINYFSVNAIVGTRMFGIGTPELLVILVVALIVLGPDRLPEIARMPGKAMGELRRATGGLSEELHNAQVMLDQEARAAMTKPLPPKPAPVTAAPAAAAGSATDAAEKKDHEPPEQ